MEWKPIETAPKGERARYGTGPDILGVSIGPGWTAYSIVRWNWHKSGVTGAWKGASGVWAPDFWMPLPPPPQDAD